MSSKLRQTGIGALATGLVLSILGSVAAAQPVAKAPPAKGDPMPILKTKVHNIAPGVHVDPDGTMSEYVSGIQPIHIPFDGVFPDGTIPQPDREAGRPMRP
ncbi:MAG: hypothetical protein K8E66_14510, partial [Phycisphaerales bacterium]|nr:hypothetical protein [Phycisphaerales bacterium]